MTTPYLVVDIDVLRRNLAAMAAWTTARGLALRPARQDAQVPRDRRACSSNSAPSG